MSILISAGRYRRKPPLNVNLLPPSYLFSPLVRCPNPSSIPTGSRLPSSMTPSESTAVLLAKSPAVQTAKRAEGINNSVWSRPMAFCRTRLGLYFVFCILSWGSGFWLPAEQYVQRPCEWCILKLTWGLFFLAHWIMEATLVKFKVIDGCCEWKAKYRV